jgi:uncharacterized protein YuzE
MVQADGLEGIVNGLYRFHYDMFADVLYVRLLSAEKTATIGDLNGDGDIVLRDEKTDQVVGITVVSWWKRFGSGSLPDSIVEIQRRIEPVAQKLAA